LLENIQRMPDEVIYCHTYRCLEENPYLALGSPNDFAAWVRDVLGDQVLFEKLVRAHILGLANLQSMRANLVSAIREYMDSGYIQAVAPPGKEFYFFRATGVVSPTQYAAHDMREFVEVLRKINQDSLYFHVFGSRVRLGNGTNDFSVWLERDLGESELGQEIGRINPYAYAPDELRSKLIQCIEKRIK
jgi:hypothetical protein